MVSTFKSAARINLCELGAVLLQVKQCKKSSVSKAKKYLGCRLLFTSEDKMECEVYAKSWYKIQDLVCHFLVYLHTQKN